MGWMHDTLKYFSHDPIHRKYHHEQLTFSAWYAFTENFVLPLSHDEVVHGKGSLLHKMPGDDWQQFANLRCLYGYMWAHPGKKLLFMGGDIGQRPEWRHEQSLEWHVLGFSLHSGIQAWVRDLNRYYRSQPALYEQDFDNAGFEWADHSDAHNSVLAFLRKARTGPGLVLALLNLTPVPRPAYRIGVPRGGWWREALNSDSEIYGGSGMGNFGGVQSRDEPSHGRPCSIEVTLPPLSVVMFEHAG
jgi:1,4-alpha-glucan branching enzyme